MISERMERIKDTGSGVKELIEDIHAWIGYYWSRRLIIVTAVVVGGIAGLLCALLKVPQYTATTSFVLEGGDSKGGLGKLAGVAAIAGLDLGGSAGGLFQGDNILELYKSRTMLVKALLRHVDGDTSQLLIDRYINYNKVKDKWAEKPELQKLNFRKRLEVLDVNTKRLYDSVLTSFSNDIRNNVLMVDKPNKNLSIIQVSVTSPDEVFSKVFNENLVKEVNDFYIQTKTKKSADNIAVLQYKVDSVRAEMTEAIYSAVKVSDATPNLNVTRQVQRLAPTQEAQFLAEANKVILSQLLQNLELSKMTLMQEQPLIQVVDKPVYPLPVEKLGKFKGIAIGGMLCAFLTLLALTGIKWYRDVMTNDHH